MSSPPPLVPISTAPASHHFLHTPPSSTTSISTEFSVLKLISNLSSPTYMQSCSCFISLKRNSSIIALQMPPSPHLQPLTQSSMLSNLGFYFMSYHPIIPMFNPKSWKNKALAAWNTIDQGSVLSFNQIELAIIYLLVALGSRNKESAVDYYEKSKKIIPNVFDVPMCLNIIQYTLLLSVFEAVVNNDLLESARLAESANENATLLDLHSLLDVAKYGSLDIPGLNQTESYRTWVCAYVWRHELELATSITINTGIIKPTIINDKAFREIDFDPCYLKLRIAALETGVINNGTDLTELLKKDSVETLQLGINYYMSSTSFSYTQNQKFTQKSQSAALALAELMLGNSGRQSKFAFLYKHVLNKCAFELMYLYCVVGKASTILYRLEHVLRDIVAYLSTCAHCGIQSGHTRLGLPTPGSVNAVRFFHEFEAIQDTDVPTGFALLNMKDSATAPISPTSSHNSSPSGSISPRSESPETTRRVNSAPLMEPKIDILENDKNSQVLKIVI
jgi:hypothetical protein